MANSLASVSWMTGNAPHIRVYAIKGNKLSETCWDGEVGGWYKSGLEGEGQEVTATCFYTDQVNIRLYVRNNQDLVEYCYDKAHGWISHPMPALEAVGAT